MQKQCVAKIGTVINQIGLDISTLSIPHYLQNKIKKIIKATKNKKCNLLCTLQLQVPQLSQTQGSTIMVWNELDNIELYRYRRFRLFTCYKRKKKLMTLYALFYRESPSAGRFRSGKGNPVSRISTSFVLLSDKFGVTERCRASNFFLHSKSS